MSSLNAARQSLAGLPACPQLQAIETDSEFPLIELRCGDAFAVVSLYGGQLLSYQSPRRTVLWHNRHARFQRGKAIRSGVPICWPWFGAAPAALQDSAAEKLPAHGLARTRYWQLESAQASDHHCRLVLGLEEGAETRALWPHAFRLRLVISLSETSLTLMLHSENSGDAPFEFAGALHSYLAIGNIHTAKVDGLENIGFRDQLTHSKQQQQGHIEFSAETDRVYLTDKARIELVDPVLAQRIQLTSFGHHAWVVWNPFEAKAATFDDLAPDHWRQFVCLETAIANDQAVTLAPGQTYSFGVEFHDAGL